MSVPASVTTDSKHSRAAILSWSIVAVAIAWAVYRPDRVRPFDILDFGEFLPLLKASEGFLAQFASVLDYGVTQGGRANVVQVLAAVLKWDWFGDWTPGWQLIQAGTMGVVTVQAFLLLRRLGATVFGSVVGASVFLFAPASARGWVRLTMGEPIGMVVVMALALRATSFQRQQRWSTDVWWFAVGAVFVILTKELMAPSLLLPLVLALTVQPDGSLAWPVWNKRNVTFVAAVGVASILALLPLAVIYLKASSSAFASQYGRSTQSVGGMIAIWIASLVPFDLAPRQPSVMWALAVATFIGLLAAGWWIGFHHPNEGLRARRLFTAAILFPVLGVLSYAPWPAYEERYAFPYLFGTSILLGVAASYLQRSSKHGLVAAATAWLMLSAFGVSGAAAHASRADAVQRAADQVVSTVASQHQADSVFVGTIAQAEPAWIGLGPTLYRLAKATDRPWPPTRDVRCREIEPMRMSASRTVIVAFASHCGRAPSPTSRIVAKNRFVDWSSWRVRVDSVQADIFLSGLTGNVNTPP